MSRWTFEAAKQIDIVDYLAGLGHKPARIRRQDYIYFSPFRQEKTPSFSVHRGKNLWYDFGEGRGGSMIELGMMLYNCDASGFLRHLDGTHFAPLPPAPVPVAEEKSAMEIVEVTELQSASLLRYLKERGISAAIARRYLKEVTFKTSRGEQNAIGFANRSGGFELRSSRIKISSKPKDYTHFNNGASALAVFEGFMDFLSYVVLRPAPLPDFLILNSLSQFDKALPLMHEYAAVQLYLDNDAAGEKVKARALAANRRFSDGSAWYANFKDLNDLLVRQLPKRSRILRR